MHGTNQREFLNEKQNVGRDLNSGIHTLIHNLVKNNPRLKTKINFIDQALQQNTKGMNDPEQRKAQKIYADYSYKVRGKEYQVADFPIKKEQKDWIDKVNRQEYNAFKKYVEVAACQVISAWIRDEYRKLGNIDTTVTITLASDYDDIIQSVDYIVTVNDLEKKTKHLYSIDLAITKRMDYVIEKIAKDKKTPIEFLAYSNLPKDFQMEKYIVAIPPDIMGAFIVELIHFIEHGKYSDRHQKNDERTPSEFDIFKRIYTLADHSSLMKTRSFDIQNGIRERVGVITNLPTSQPNHGNQKRF